MIPIRIDLIVSESQQLFDLTVTETNIPVSLEPQTVIVSSSIPDYDGDYDIIPTGEAQVLQTKNCRMTENVTVNPIPSNYGLITWNGSIITVS